MRFTRFSLRIRRRFDTYVLFFRNDRTNRKSGRVEKMDASWAGVGKSCLALQISVSLWLAENEEKGHHSVSASAHYNFNRDVYEI